MEDNKEDNGFVKSMKSAGRSFAMGMKAGAFIGGLVLVVGGAVAVVQWVSPNK